MGGKRSHFPARSLACRLAALCLVTGLTATARPTRADDSTALSSQSTSARDQAKDSFNRGLALARGKDYRAAIAAFEHAYQLAPHYMALWNIARSHAALQENDQAVRFFKRYLNEGGSALSADQRAQVESEIAELQRRNALEDEPKTKSPEQQPPRLQILGVPPGATLSLNGAPWREGDPLTAGTNELVIQKEGYAIWSQPVELTGGITTTVQVAMTPKVPPATPIATAQGNDATGEPSGHRTLAYVLAGTGVGVMLGSAGLFLWNDGRYNDWQREDVDLQRSIATNGASSETNLRQNTNNDLLDSVQAVDVVTVVGGVVGLGLLGSGLYLYFSESPKAPSKPNSALVVGPGSLLLQGTW